MKTTIKLLYIFILLMMCKTSFADIDVFVDPGHGGSDSGSPTHILSN